jgi:RHH-type proline utilization regulon transcriptional repressor/proline dehydrogenase/delta 1-pyrroline-5-carboxylate dehydrogenase
MLKGALQELRIGRTDALNVDVGPVITAEAQANIERHIEAMRARGHKVSQVALPEECAHGTFVAPTIIEIGSMADLGREVFGPVLHVLRFRREGLNRLIDEINASGYGLTFGLHTRLDETVANVTARIRVGNIYINRNVIGAIVGVQPFGGRGLSGTGPKAGGPLYLGRLVRRAPVFAGRGARVPGAVQDFADWLEAQGKAELARKARRYVDASALGAELELAGPVGERNLYALHPRGSVLLVPETRGGLLEQMAAVLATGNRGVVQGMALPDGLPESVARRFAGDAQGASVALVEGGTERVRAVLAQVAGMEGSIVTVHAADPGAPLAWNCDWLLEEVSNSINTTAAGGNASLMMIG